MCPISVRNTGTGSKTKQFKTLVENICQNELSILRETYKDHPFLIEAGMWDREMHACSSASKQTRQIMHEQTCIHTHTHTHCQHIMHATNGTHTHAYAPSQSEFDPPNLFWLWYMAWPSTTHNPNSCQYICIHTYTFTYTHTHTQHKLPRSVRDFRIKFNSEWWPR